MKLAYTFDEAAAAAGVSRDVINRAVAKGDLVPSYPSARPVLLADDLREWLAGLPNEKPRPNRRAS